MDRCPVASVRRLKITGDMPSATLAANCDTQSHRKSRFSNRRQSVLRLASGSGCGCESDGVSDEDGCSLIT